MLYTSKTKRALRLCLEAHAGQSDRSGMPYALHPIHLAEHLTNETEVCAALLHDTLEDTDLNPCDLTSSGMDAEVVEAVRLLTHEPGVTYFDYVRGCAENPIARAVKVQDLRHNMELGRLDVVGARDRTRLNKYLKARVILGDLTEECVTPWGAVWLEVNGKAFPFAVDAVGDTGLSDPAPWRLDAPKGLPARAPARPERVLVLGLDTGYLEAGDTVRMAHAFGTGVGTVSFAGAVLDGYLAGEPACALVALGAYAVPSVLRRCDGAFVVAGDPLADVTDATSRHLEVVVAWGALEVPAV